MKCPQCGADHIRRIEDIPSHPSELYSPCPHCITISRPKDKPVLTPPLPPCSCGRRFIDEVMADIYLVLRDLSVIPEDEPLAAIGTPLINPGVFVRKPPVLPSRSLLLISNAISRNIAAILYDRVPELMGIIRNCGNTPGAGDVKDQDSVSGSENLLLCGCDMRADVFMTGNGPVIISKLQHALHIEFPKGIDPKVRSVEDHIRQYHPDVFIDACSGPGTLGIIAALAGVREVVMCDVWYASILCSMLNLKANRTTIGLTTISLHRQITNLDSVYTGWPKLVCEASGPGKRITVLQGSYEHLEDHIPKGDRLTAFDPFDKPSFIKNDRFIASWKEKIGGEVFIP